MAKTETETRDHLYYAAIEADQAFHAELVRVYGEHEAGDARYQAKSYADAALQAACERSREAKAQWADWMAAHRNSNAPRCICATAHPGEGHIEENCPAHDIDCDGTDSTCFVCSERDVRERPERYGLFVGFNPRQVIG